MSITISSKLNTPAAPVVAPRDTAARPAAKTETAATDKVSLGAQTATQETYADPRSKVATTPADLSAMLEQSNKKAQEIIDLILPLIEQQGLEIGKVVSGEQKLNADPAAIEAAQAAIADGGEFSVEKVAQRILSFAEGVIGNDPSKLASVRAAVEEGFKQATEMLGGTLPEISQKTYTTIMARFDQWQNEGMAADKAQA